jgi:hypothetical protein
VRAGGAQAAAAAAAAQEGGSGEWFLRVHWVAVPEALRARRVNRRRTLARGGGGGGGAWSQMPRGSFD